MNNLRAKGLQNGPATLASLMPGWQAMKRTLYICATEVTRATLHMSILQPQRQGSGGRCRVWGVGWMLRGGTCDDGLGGHDASQQGDDKHGPVDRLRDGSVEGVVDIISMVPKVGSLAQVGDHHGWVHNAAKAQLHIQEGLS